MPVKPNRIWSLTEDNEIATKQVWAVLLKQFGYDLDNFTYKDLEHHNNFVASTSPGKPPQISSTSIVSDCVPVSKRTEEVFDTLNGESKIFGENDPDVKVTPKEWYHHNLHKINLALIHQTFWSGMRNDSPDNELLRYIRARKFKVGPAVEMAVHSFDWKHHVHPVNKYSLEGDAALYFDKSHPEVINAYSMGKVYLRGRDKQGGAICVVHVKDHFGHDCPEKDFEMVICSIIEWFRLSLKNYKNGTDGANILFDMSGFSLKNADLNAVKFLAKAFEANYPESLSAIWIHKAPWIFNAVWKIIKGWFDPVVASKIHFTKSVSDLEQFVDKKHIPKDLGGLDDYKFKYVPPTKESLKKPADDVSQSLLQERKQLTLTFLETTLAWINAKSKEESTKLLNQKLQLGAELAQNYIKLDPYVRNRSVYDRDGNIGEIEY